jgi:twitching motility protein PilT
MTLESLIAMARDQGASDLHLEAGLPCAVRIRDSLRTVGEPIPAKTLLEFARHILPGEAWNQFVDRRSADLSQTIQGVRCRINVLQTARGVGFAIRLLAGFEATLETLNLHPDLKKFSSLATGLVVVSGPTGCGKSSTLAALIQEINLGEARHIVTIESPIEYSFRPRRAYIRQREVGRDTPSFEQALLDAMREDPDVLMVGEMREPETMRLTLNAAETGHLVLTTVHSSNCMEALQRIVSAFPSEIQANVAAVLADSLAGVIAQRLHYRPEFNMRVPECEILVPSAAIRHCIRNRDFFKIPSFLETGAEHGMWTYQRYRSWIDKRPSFHRVEHAAEGAPAEEASAPLPLAPLSPKRAPGETKRPAPASPVGTGPIEIEPDEEFGKILQPRKP